MVLIPTPELADLASEIVERQWHKQNPQGKAHSFYDTNGDLRYREEVQDEFNEILDILDEYINSEEA